MTLTSQDVIQDADLTAIVEQANKETMGYRRAFRQRQRPEGADGPTVDITYAPSDMFETDDYEHIAEGQELPRADPADFSHTQATLLERGFEATVTDQAVRYGRLEEELDLAAQQADVQARAFDEIAGSQLLANVRSETVGDADGVLSWTDIVDGMVELQADDYSPDLLLLEPYGWGDYLKDDHISFRGTGMSDSAVESGDPGARMAGVSYFPVTANPGLDTHSAVMVDTSKYGLEFSDPQLSGTTSYREPEKRQTVYQIHSSMAWESTDSQAALVIDG